MAGFNFDDGGLSREVKCDDADYADVNAGMNLAFFEVTFNETIDLHTNYVSTSVYQKGNKLGTYTNIKPTEKFEPARFHQTLLRMVSEKDEACEHVASGGINTTFNSSMVIDIEHMNGIQPGKYILVVAAAWNKIAEDNPILKDIRLAITSPGDVHTESITTSRGLEFLKWACLENARKRMDRGDCR